MNLRKKIGQMLIMGFTGCEVSASSEVAQWLQTDGLGGVLLFDYDLPAKTFGKNLRDKLQIQQLTSALKKYSSSQVLPLWIGLDYEGGAVDRLQHIPGCIKTLSPWEQAQLPAEILSVELKKMAVQLKDLGFNLNFSPVVDLNLNEQEGIIGRFKRSFSAVPEEVVRMAREVVNAYKDEGIICSYKHFPGHGSATGDTHEGFVEVTLQYNDQELIPYQKLCAHESTVMVMTAHVVNRQLDPSGLPATLSYPILTKLLREKLKFTGIIISDDLQMQAISQHYSLDEAVCLTLNAGADMLIFGNQWGWNTPLEIIDCIENLVLSGRVERARIDSAYARIMKLKN